MKQQHLTEGSTCYTRVSGRLIKVRVVRIENHAKTSGYGATGSTRVYKRYRLQRLDSNSVLPKARPASALHPETYTYKFDAIMPDGSVRHPLVKRCINEDEARKAIRQSSRFAGATLNLREEIADGIRTIDDETFRYTHPID